MNLSFSTNKWNDFNLNDFFDIASEYKFGGIEIHDVSKLKDLDIKNAYHLMTEKKIKVPCIDMVSDISKADKTAFDEFGKCIDAAKALNSSYIRLKAMSEDNVSEFINKVLPIAEENGIVLLVETVGAYADTEKLRELLISFSSDYIAALWDLHYPYRMHGESAEKSVTNLGAYIKHVHIKDSESLDEHSLIGEGTLPVDKFMNALRSINYNGFISIEWDPNWDEEISDHDIIFPHFVSFMSRYKNLSRAKSTLYEK